MLFIAKGRELSEEDDANVKVIMFGANKSQSSTVRLWISVPTAMFSSTLAFRLVAVNTGALFSLIYIITLTVEVLESPGPLSSAWTVILYFLMTSKFNDWLTDNTPETWKKLTKKMTCY